MCAITLSFRIWLEEVEHGFFYKEFGLFDDYKQGTGLI